MYIHFTATGVDAEYRLVEPRVLSLIFLIKSLNSTTAVRSPPPQNFTWGREGDKGGKGEFVLTQRCWPYIFIFIIMYFLFYFINVFLFIKGQI